MNENSNDFAVLLILFLIQQNWYRVATQNKKKMKVMINNVFKDFLGGGLKKLGFGQGVPAVAFVLVYRIQFLNLSLVKKGPNY